MPGQKVQKYTPQDFFPRSGANKPKEFIFNAAPINKLKAKDDTKDHVKTNKNKRSAFMSKIYQDEDDEDMKVFNMVESDDEDNTKQIKESTTVNKRKQKEQEKTQSTHKGKNKGSTISTSKIGKLKFTQGSLGLFAINEIHSNYIIVNYTRNVKGYLPTDDIEDLVDKLQVGQLIVAAVLSEGTAKYNAGTSGNQNKKLQLTISPEIINKALSAETITTNMFLQGEVKSKEAKGYLVNFGLKDKSQGFIPFPDNDSTSDIQIGQLIQVIVKKVMEGSKIIKCEVLNSQNKNQNVMQKEDFTLYNVKPGFLVSAKISKLLENGLEVGFLGGIIGTIFIDHIEKESVQKYKVGEKIIARVIATDPVTKNVSLSQLPHIVQVENSKVTLLHQGITVGKLFEKVKVQNMVFGSSYSIKLAKDVIGFLHKIHTAAPIKAKTGSDDDEPQAKLEELTEGQVLDKVRVKEVNYFDGKPVLSMRSDIVNSQAMDYKALESGMFVTGKIEEVNEIEKYIIIRINDFVKGKLYLEHMADFPLKMIPPKFRVVGKEIKVRVFGVDPEDRNLDFTKKETLFKAKTPVYQSYREVQKGAKIVGIVVGENDHGYIIKTFGNIKCLLTHTEIAANGKSGKKDYKFGNIVKAYVLFKKKDQGMALTLDKIKAKELRKESTVKQKLSTDKSQSEYVSKSIETEYYPNEQDISSLKEKLKALVKPSAEPNNLGKLYTFRVIESSNKFITVKSIDAAKKSQNIFAVIPSCLVSNFNISINSEVEDLTFQGLVLEIFNGIPIVTSIPELVKLKDQIPVSNESLQNDSIKKFIGFVSETNRKGVTVRFMGGLKKLILIKDLETTNNFQSVYTIGKVVRVGFNKLDRLCLKQRVIYYDDSQLYKQDKVTQIESYYQQFEKNQVLNKVKIGDKLEAQIQLVKDYGLIVSFKEYQNFTGFIMNEHKQDQVKAYKEGIVLQCVVLDIDFEKNIIDLSERLASSGKNSTSIKLDSDYKAIVELSKEDYLILSLKKHKQVLAICMMQSFNKDEAQNANEKHQIGDEIDISALKTIDNNNILAVPIQEASAKKQKNTSTNKETTKSSELKPGTQVTCQIMSIKGQCAFLQIPFQSQLVIGRLHKMECQSVQEFQSFSQGDKVQVKILKISVDKKKTWVEFTRRKEHMVMSNGLNPELVKQMINSYDDLKDGKQYSALISDINYQYSQPIQINLSPFIKGQISFSSIITPEDLIKQGEAFKEQYKVGDSIKVTYRDGKFSIVNQDKTPKEKGGLVVARFVKAIKGKGIAVQIDDGIFGFIEIVEITDEVIGNVFSYISEKLIFPARIIDKNKEGKLVLSSRESVVDQKQWDFIGPEGKSIHFQKYDIKRQSQGNQRNKILKFGAEASLQQDDLCIGYITNIGKSGCFIQIGHNCVVRSSLGELSDQSSFNFTEEMPVGRVVIGRITKIDEKNGKKLFNFSLRRSVVVYGVSAVDRSHLNVGSQIEVIAMNVLADKVFAQIKGSYLKIKVKGINESQDSVKEGDHIIVKLSKVTKQKITGIYEGLIETAKGLNQDEQVLENVWQSVNEEAQKDVQALKELNSQNEIDVEMFKQRKDVDEDEVEMQMEDLKQLEQKTDDDDDEVAEGDSDAEEIQRIIKESRVYEDDEEEDEEFKDNNEKNQDEDSDEDMDGQDESEDNDISDNDSEMIDLSKTNKSGKQALKARVKEEQQIRKRENQLRDNTDQPQSIDDYERLLVQNKDQSYVWIQYLAFMLDKLGIESARRVAERAVKSVSISNEEDKFNIWIAYMNLENNFGNQNTLQSIIKRALDVNDRKKIYLQLINIYTNSHKYQYIEDIFKSLVKKYNTSLKIWSSYLDFLFQMKDIKKDPQAVHKFLITDIEFSDPKAILQRSLQSLPQKKHVNIITKFGMLEYKSGNQENGRTMFEGIVNNYPKRMDIWAIYMDMEVKYGGSHNKQQARHLFERCLTNEMIQKKPKKMKLVFQKYMEFEMTHGNKKNVDKLRERVEQYLENAFDKEKKAQHESDSE